MQLVRRERNRGAQGDTRQSVKTNKEQETKERCECTCNLALEIKGSGMKGNFLDERFRKELGAESLETKTQRARRVPLEERDEKRGRKGGRKLLELCAGEESIEYKTERRAKDMCAAHTSWSRAVVLHERGEL